MRGLRKAPGPGMLGRENINMHFLLCIIVSSIRNPSFIARGRQVTCSSTPFHHIQLMDFLYFTASQRDTDFKETARRFTM